MQAHELPSMLSQEPKRRKTDSFFYHERHEALDPSLLHPTSPLEQANNIFYAQDIGKQYQLVVKDFQIEVRDGRIRAKDKEIADLGEQLESAHALIDSMAGRDLIKARKVAHHIIRLNRRHCNNQRLYRQKLQISNMAIKDRDVILRTLHKDLQSHKAELQNLKERRLTGHVLAFIRGLLGLPNTPRESQLEFPFLKLAPELRNIVYKHSLVLHRPIDFWPISHEYDTNKFACLNRDLKQINGNLLRVCRQVHKEAVGILYGCNRFRFSHRRAWTILAGFLMRINTNCQFLTHISVKIPDCWSQELGVPRPRMGARRPRDEADIKHILRMFGKSGPELDAPAGPPSNDKMAFTRASEIMATLPSLKYFTLFVPHDEMIFGFAAENIASILGPHDLTLAYGHELRCNPQRTFVFLRRPSWRSPITGHVNTDDDAIMGRARLAMLIENAVIKSGSYGITADGVSYVIDGGEEYNFDIPEHAPRPGSSGSIAFWPFRAAKRLLGY